MCGAAQSLDQMILFRLLQGAFGAGNAAFVPGGDARSLSAAEARKYHGDLGRGACSDPFSARRSAAFSPTPIVGAGCSTSMCRSASQRVAGIWFFFKDSAAAQGLRFDWFGFAGAGGRVGALQTDARPRHGPGWSGSAARSSPRRSLRLGLYLFLLHMCSWERIRSSRPKYSTTRNFVSGLVADVL